MQTDPRSAVRRPYPIWTYPCRYLWQCVQWTVWRLAWKRIPVLRGAILRLFGAQMPWHCLLSGSVRVHFPWQLRIGNDVAIADGVNIYNLGGISIGDRAVISQDVYLCGGTHDYTSASYPLIRKGITIGNDVWIGAGAFIGPGVRVGDGAVVGARAVVFRDVPPWKVVIGNPARILKDRIMRNS